MCRQWDAELMLLLLLLLRNCRNRNYSIAEHLIGVRNDETIIQAPCT